MAAPTHGQTAEDKARKHNTVYTKWAGCAKIKGSSPLQHLIGLISLKPAIAHICIYPSVSGNFNKKQKQYFNMKNVLFLLLFFTTFYSFAQDLEEFTNQITTTKTQKHKRISGTKVFCIAPSNYEYVKELARYQRKDKLYFQVIETSGSSFTEAKSNFTKEALRAKGITDDGILKNLFLNEYNCVYTEGPSKYPGETKLIMAFGDDDFLVFVAGVCKNSDDEGKKELQEIFKTIYYDKSFNLNPLELANFEFDESITGFKHAMSMSNMIIYTENGKSDLKNPNAGALMNIAMMPQMSEMKAEQFANDLPWRFEKGGAKLKNRDIQKEKIGGFTAFILDTKTEIESKEGILYQVLLVGDKSSILFAGTADRDIESFKAKFKKTVQSIRFK
ncbi:hypothetical protein [Fulvitalea axinellae]